MSSEDLVNLSYEDLTDKRFNKSIAIRQSNNVYNQSLIASMIENHGLEYTRGWTKNLLQIFLEDPKVMIELRSYQLPQMSPNLL